MKNICSILLCILLMCAPACAEEARTGSITGRVMIKDGVPMAKGGGQQNSQSVFAATYPGMPKNSGPRAGLIVRDTDGAWHITHTGWMNGPVCLAPLNWHDGLDGAPTSIPPAQ